MQFFLLVPLMAQLFLDGRAASGLRAALLKWGLVVLLIVCQLVVTFALMQDASLSAVSPLFSDHVYVKPWCRVTPYAIGCALAFVHFERTEPSAANAAVADSSRSAQTAPHALSPAAWKALGSAAKVRSVMLASLAVMVASFAAFYLQWRCPDSEHECEVWNAQFAYGFFVSDQWSKQVAAFFYAACYLVWTCPLAALCYILICAEPDNAYDPLRIKLFLGHNLWTPMARLTYGAYLVHIPLQLIFTGADPFMQIWFLPRILLQVIGFIFFAYLTSLAMFLLIEKPIMNICAALLHAERQEPGAARREPQTALHRSLSVVSDPDSEAIVLVSPGQADFADLNPPPYSLDDARDSALLQPRAAAGRT
jgi:hypothetical protein